MAAFSRGPREHWLKPHFSKNQVAKSGGEFDRNDVPMVAASVVSANAKVWLWDDCFVFGGYRYRASCRKISDFRNTEERVASYGVFNLGVQYSPSFCGLDGLKLSFVVDNLFDRDYCDYEVYSAWSGNAYYPAAGRSYMFSVRYDF